MSAKVDKRLAYGRSCIAILLASLRCCIRSHEFRCAVSLISRWLLKWWILIGIMMFSTCVGLLSSVTLRVIIGYMLAVKRVRHKQLRMVLCDLLLSGVSTWALGAYVIVLLNSWWMKIWDNRRLVMGQSFHMLGVRQRSFFCSACPRPIKTAIQMSFDTLLNVITRRADRPLIRWLRLFAHL